MTLDMLSFREIKKDPKSIAFNDLGDPREWTLIAYCDASLHNLNKFNSVTADVIMLLGNALTKKGANPNLLMKLLNKGMIPEHT